MDGTYAEDIRDVENVYRAADGDARRDAVDQTGQVRRDGTQKGHKRSPVLSPVRQYSQYVKGQANEHAQRRLCSGTDRAGRTWPARRRCRGE